MRRICTLVLFGGALILAACGGQAAAPGEIPVTLSANGDAAAGDLVFQDRGCRACHSTTTLSLVGPGMAGVFQEEGVDLPEGVDYGGKLPNGQERTEENIAAWIRSGGQGQIGVMNPNELSEQEMADLLAYMRTLKK